MGTSSLLFGFALVVLCGGAQATPIVAGAGAVANAIPPAPIVDVKKGGWKHDGHPGRHLGSYGNPGKRKGWHKNGGPRFF